ncbi:protease modulator HflC [Ahniella affigens]|uniref:Protein HflC n=1 Tax=Ahniella affigens TaxID=2021234 RepID=A0A2P1PT55_9GAMM|nr:protease modulator HflC [Ahniella affigens]AVP98016.1 protease modulator HflC [Ahniella affigens]
MKFAISIIVFIVLAIAASGMFVVNEGERAVVLQFGKVVSADFAPGLHYRYPFIQDVKKYEGRIVTLDKEPQRYLTSEKKDVLVDFFVKWRIADVARFYTSTGGDEILAETRLESTVRNALGKEIITRKVRDVVSDQRAGVMKAMRDQLNAAVDELGIQVIDMRVMSIDLPTEVSQPVFDRMSAERKSVANRLRSEGTEASLGIRAQADQTQKITIAEADRDASLIRGEGDAEAAKIYARAYQKDPEFYAFYRSLEAYRSSFANGDSVLVLDPKSEFFQYFSEGAKK